jgi:ferric-dicitrate binding protein FerR (iron transport regulator)
MEQPDRFHDWDAAYLLGALDPDDRRAFERHLTTCTACAAAVSELAGLPGLLGRLPADEAIALAARPDEVDASGSRVGARAHQPSPVQRLAHTVAEKRRRRRRRMTGALAGAGAVLVTAGVLVGIAIGPQAESTPAATPSGTIRVMEPVDSSSITADLRVTEKGWGTRFDWTCEYAYANGDTGSARTYELVITDATGADTVIASWTAGGARSGDLAASTGVATTDIDRVEIRSAQSDVPLVRTTL